MQASRTFAELTRDERKHPQPVEGDEPVSPDEFEGDESRDPWVDEGESGA